jgi:hypothetical protein
VASARKRTGASEAGWAKGWVGRKVGRAEREEKEILNLPRLWKFAQGDLEGILAWGFFLNSFKLLKYFRKMKYAMPWYATLGKIN